MTDECVITRAGAAAFDESDGSWSPAAGVTIYDGPCRVKEFGETQGSRVVIGSIDESLSRYVVTVPVSVIDVAVDDVITVGSTVDEALDGRVFVVVAVPAKSWPIDRDLLVEERGR